ncbi:CSEP0370 putative effector protein [Blumeria hordei DH14]|uniref:CSEP0370 putative effector protein n=1 Tax=Blumeria graminis f. sp. hordei (strain DH14) TaxID=546991 RepID=N1J8Z3_BLUG1|nr:CSEP0370 putative effector protein [Blumeria hordei DH14]
MTSAYQIAMRFSSFMIASVTLCSLVSALVRSTNTPPKSHVKADNYDDPTKVLVFNCDGQIFSSRRIRSAARSACKVIRKKKRSFWNPNNLNLKVYESSVKVDTIGDKNIVSVDNTFSWPIKSGIYRLLPGRS